MTALQICAGLIVLCLAAAASQRLTTDVGDLDLPRKQAYVIWTLGAGVAFAAACAVVVLRPPPGAVVFVLLTGAVMRAIAFVPPPLLSTDVYRYVWDGRVQRAGINPYQSVPADPKELLDPARRDHQRSMLGDLVVAYLTAG